MDLPPNFQRHWGFGDAPHYFDEKFTEELSLDGLFVKELCPVCKAHLSHSGICLNACHLNTRQQATFSAIMKESIKKVDEDRQ